MRRLVALGVLALASVFIAAAQGAPQASEDYIVVLKDNTDPAAIVGKHKAKYGADISLVYKYALKGYAARLSLAAASAIAADSSVAFVAEDGEVGVASCSSTLTQCLPLALDRIDAEQSSALGPGPGLQASVNVAVLDTGIDLTHPDLNVAGGFDCVAKNRIGQDEEGHGTHVAGTIGAVHNSIGVVGVLPGARLWAVRVLNHKGYGTLGRIICGIDFVTGTRTDADPSNDIAVANMSLSASGSDDRNCGQSNKDAVHAAICASVAAGVTYVVAAGNSGQDLQNVAPASYDEVLAVTAMTDFDGRPGALGGETCLPGVDLQDDTAAFFSNFASTTGDRVHTVAAAGVCVLSTFLGGGYEFISGTSQSAPAVAGTVALCIASGPCAGLTPAQIIQKIVGDAATYNNANRNSGYGFQGDPLRPISGKYYGYLIRAGLY